MEWQILYIFTEKYQYFVPNVIFFYYKQSILFDNVSIIGYTWTIKNF